MAAPSRKFSLLDAMVFVAATAAGLGITRSLADTRVITRHINVLVNDGKGSGFGQGAGVWCLVDRGRAQGVTPSWDGRLLIYRSKCIAFWPGPLLAAWSLATSGLGFREGRRIARRPGSAVGLVVLLALPVVATLWPPLLINYTGPTGPIKLNWSLWWPCCWSSLPRTVAFGVVVAWSVLAIRGRWMPVRGWHDRLGRAFGAGWIAMAAAGIASEWLPCLVR